jgi:hypothetical protein
MDASGGLFIFEMSDGWVMEVEDGSSQHHGGRAVVVFMTDVISLTGSDWFAPKF